MRLSRSLAVATFLPVLAAVAAFLYFPLIRAVVAQIVNAPQPLEAYGVDLQQTSVSGVSSGAGMAVQMHVAHSSIMRGVGIIAGVAYDCSDSRLPTVALRVERGLNCIDGGPPYGGSAGAAFSVERTSDAAKDSGAIDDPGVNLPRQKIWLFSGYNDGEVHRAAMDSVAQYYANYIPTANIFYKTNNKAPHALVTDNYGGPCLALNPGFINNCQYDSAGRLLEHIYGHLNQRNSAQTGALLPFDQSQFTGAMTPGEVSLAGTGYVYVPTACQKPTKGSNCRVHIVFHGCLQYAELVGDAVTRHAGYNEWADTNQIIVLYPQTTKALLNPNGCFDWWGLSDQLPLNADFARKTGYQIKAFRAMLDRLAQNFSAPSGSDTFGTPQDFTVPDSTEKAIALVWKPNSAAAGFNIYRSTSSNGPFTKVNSTLVQGASFADQDPQLFESTTYYYQIKAVDQVGNESLPSGTMVRATTARPAACDPYFGNNVVHVTKMRAYDLGLSVFALGTNDPLGALDITTLNQLTGEGPFRYRKGYCP